MRIILKRPSGIDHDKIGVCAYDLISFRHHPADKDSCLTLALADGTTLLVQVTEQDDGTLERIIAALLSPSGTADCRDIPGLYVSKQYHPKVFLTNESVPVTITDEAVPVTIADEVVPVTLEDEVVAVTLEDEVVAVTIADEIVPVTIEDSSVPVYVMNEPIKTINLF